MSVVRQNIDASMSENGGSHFLDFKHWPTIYHLNSNFKFGNAFSLVVYESSRMGALSAKVYGYQVHTVHRLCVN